MKRIEISGMGGGYEEACQKMLQAGIAWLNSHKERDELRVKTHEEIYGILQAESADAKELEKAILAACPDCSGAMHQSVMMHLLYISGHGVDAWHEHVTKAREEKADRE